MPKIVYPRPCPKCKKVLKNRFTFCTHKKYCGTDVTVPCIHCGKQFSRKDKMTAHVRKFHSEASKRKVAENEELSRMELLHAAKVPRMSVDDHQTGGAVSTRGTKRSVEEEMKSEVKAPKISPDNEPEFEENHDKPLFKVNVKKLGDAKRWKNNTVVNQKFIMTLDQQRGPNEDEDLSVEATFAFADTMDRLIDELKISDDYEMTFQIGSREHRRDASQGSTATRIPVGDFMRRAAIAQAMLQKLAHILNSGEFITNDVGFSASILFSRPEQKGGKSNTAKPGEKIWKEMVKESKCVCEIKNKDDLCCGRAIVVMREYAKRQTKEENTFENIRQDRGKNSQQLKEAKKLYEAAGVPEGPCGLEEVAKFQDVVGPQGFRIIVVDATKGGVIFKGSKFPEAPHRIALVKSVFVDVNNRETAHFDGLYSIPGFMQRSYFCDKCCKGYNTEDHAHHRCQAKNCPACKQSASRGQPGCSDFTLWGKPDRSCKICRREFYGEDCFRAHVIQYETVDEEMQTMKQHLEKELQETLPSIMVMNSVCDQYRKCQECLVSYKVKKDLPHKCLHAQCHHCLDYVPIYTHQCYITSEEEKAYKRTLQAFKKKQRKKEKLLAMTVEGLTDTTTQDMIDKLVARRKKKLWELEQINKGVPMVEIKAQAHKEKMEELCEQVIEKMMDKEGFKLEEITPAMIEERMPKEPKPTVGSTDCLVFADIECILDSTDTFIPILICFSREDSSTIHHHWGTNCVDLFLDTMKTWIKEEKKKDKGVRNFQVYFHNMRGFDGVLTTNSLYKKNLKVTDQMGTGTKILYFKHDKLIFKDSLSFLKMPLSNFPKTFGLKELKKGFFPHKFSKLENLQYEGTIPDLSYFEPEQMSTDKKKECETWHAEQVTRGENWNFEVEMLEYCKSDVQLLKEGCLKFAKDTQRDAGFNPLLQCITIASTCHYFWRNYQMQPKTIAVEPVKGWNGVRMNQSKIAFQWLYVEDQKLGGNRIKHARNGGEQVLQIKQGSVKVDGFDAVTNTVFEFQGCYFHGCRKCFRTQRLKMNRGHPDRTVEEMFQVTQRKTEMLQKAGYTVIEKWECDFKKELSQNKELETMVKNMSWVMPLEPRDAFYGGRTGMAACLYKADINEEISYVDFTSLYPTINKYGTYPIGHPTIIVNPVDQNIHNYFGLAKVDVLAPERLLHPVLPVRVGGKLMFPLCQKCAEDQLDIPWYERSCDCSHNDTERVMTGSWCTPELDKAVEKGYKILKIHEVWHFPEEQRKEGLFAPYVNTWLKYKTEASGWPADCDTEKKKAEYVKQYEEIEGIQLENIEKNPGKKQVAKLMLNSFWGKFGENEHRPQTITIQDEEEWQKLHQEESIFVKDVRIFNEDVMEVSVMKKEEMCESSGKINIFIACFTTTLARLKLYEELEKLQERVLYYDTDSVIYRTKPGEKMIPTGKFLGQMTDELEGDTITDFGSAGPKSYCYKTHRGKSECKNKGTKSCHETNQTLNYESMRSHIEKELNDPQERRRIMLIQIKNHFVRDNTYKTVSLQDLVKVFGVNWDKRVVEKGTGVTYPYGYVRL